MNTFNKIILASRPKTLPASIGPVLLGLALAYTRTNSINLTIALITLICTMSLQISSNIINDYYDGLRGVDGEDRIGPKRIASTDKNLLKKASITSMLISLTLGIYLMIQGGPIIIAIGICSMLFAFLYTGGPLPLSYIALGEVLALIFFGPIAVFGTYYLQTKQVQLMPVIIGIGPGLIAATIMSINNLRDIKSDSKTKKLTLAIFLGESKARVFTLVLIILSTFVPYFGIYVFKLPAATILVTMVFYLFFKNWIAIYRQPISEKFNNYLANTGKYLFLYCLVYSICLVL